MLDPSDNKMCKILMLTDIKQCLKLTRTLLPIDFYNYFATVNMYICVYILIYVMKMFFLILLNTVDCKKGSTN